MFLRIVTLKLDRWLVSFSLILNLRMQNSKNEVKFVKSGKCEGITQLFIKTKNIPETLSVITNLASKKIEVTQMPKLKH
jgi:hypothetical protein